MNSRSFCAAMACATMLLLAGCGSTAPTRFYTLVPGAPDASGTPGAPIPATAPFQIEVQPVGVPPQIDVPQLVVRQGSGQLALLDSQQWAAPLGSEVRAALSQLLRERLGAQDVYGLPRAGGATVYRIKVDLRRFDAWPGQRSDVEAAWSIRPVGSLQGGEAQPLVCNSRVSVRAADGFPALVQAHQTALAGVAADIAGVVASWQQSGTAPPCPVPSPSAG